jgi:putative membrane protein
MIAKAAAALAVLALPALATPALAQNTTPIPTPPAQIVPDTTTSSTAGKVTVQGARVSQNLTASEFLTHAASSGLFEVEAGRLAVDKAGSDQVRSFGQQMVTDHTQANQDLMALARQNGLSVPATMRPDHQQQLQALSRASGTEFDRLYMVGQVTAHEEAVNLYSSAANANAPDMAPFRSFAAQTLPILQNHLAMAQSMTGTGVPTARQ